MQVVKEGEKITLMSWGNAMVQSITKAGPVRCVPGCHHLNAAAVPFYLHRITALGVGGQVVTAMTVTMLPTDQDYKGTQKFTWLAKAAEEEPVEVSKLA
jgi:hypothetical protein